MIPSSQTTRNDAPDVLIVGAGPIGIETAIELGRRDLRALVLDAGAIGQQILEFPPATRWFSSPERLSIGGIPFTTPSAEKGTREEYLAYLRQVVDACKVEVRTFQRVETIVPLADQSGHRVTSTSLSGLQHVIDVPTVVIATGGTARPRQLGIPGEDSPHVHRSIGEPHRFHGRRVLIIGGKNSACDAAVLAYRCGARVTLCHRGQAIHDRVKYWIKPELEAMLRSGQIEGCFGMVPLRIEPDGVVLRSLENDATRTVEVDDVLIAIGYESDQTLLQKTGVQLLGSEEAVEHNPLTMETNVPGMYVAGTVVAGTQAKFRVYIENSHVHARRIAAALSNSEAPPEPVYNDLPES
ncbi:MAG: hypothetical protein CBC35_01635 [Planctomycetes bacterium TMED75]|nr:thioredoxin reductase [Planctomycetaceae bacterium]OUU96261.1 MAG: hypothetical protein CBC35_01635 [Planctomycetes bacterium TMED75]